MLLDKHQQLVMRKILRLLQHKVRLPVPYRVQALALLGILNKITRKGPLDHIKIPSIEGLREEPRCLIAILHQEGHDVLLEGHITTRAHQTRTVLGQVEIIP